MQQINDYMVYFITKILKMDYKFKIFSENEIKFKRQERQPFHKTTSEMLKGKDVKVKITLCRKKLINIYMEVGKLCLHGNILPCGYNPKDYYEVKSDSFVPKVKAGDHLFKIRSGHGWEELKEHLIKTFASLGIIPKNEVKVVMSDIVKERLGINKTTEDNSEMQRKNKEQALTNKTEGPVQVLYQPELQVGIRVDKDKVEFILANHNVLESIVRENTNEKWNWRNMHLNVPCQADNVLQAINLCAEGVNDFFKQYGINVKYT